MHYLLLEKQVVEEFYQNLGIAAQIFSKIPDTHSARLKIFKYCEKLYLPHKAEIEKRILHLKVFILSDNK